MPFRLFGPKSEKLSPAQTALLFQETSVSAGEGFALLVAFEFGSEFARAPSSHLLNRKLVRS